MGTPNMKKYRYRVRTRIGYAYGTCNLRTEPYQFLLSCFAVVDAAKPRAVEKYPKLFCFFIVFQFQRGNLGATGKVVVM